MPNHNYTLKTEHRGENVEKTEFVGPIKIVFVDRQITKKYVRTVWYAAAIALSEILLATSSIFLFFYSLSFRKNEVDMFKGLHVLLGTLGLQSCLLGGILVLNPYSGASLPMTVTGRKHEHIVINLFGLVTCCISAFSAYEIYGLKAMMTVHSILGIAAIGAVVLCGLSGFCIINLALPSNENATVGCGLCSHIMLGIIAATLSSLCFATGISKTSFLKWLPEYDMYNYLNLACASYTTIILYKPIVMLLSRNRIGFGDFY